MQPRSGTACSRPFRAARRVPGAGVSSCFAGALPAVARPAPPTCSFSNSSPGSSGPRQGQDSPCLSLVPGTLVAVRRIFRSGKRERLQSESCSTVCPRLPWRRPPAPPVLCGLSVDSTRASVAPFSSKAKVQKLSPSLASEGRRTSIPPTLLLLPGPHLPGSEGTFGTPASLPPFRRSQEPRHPPPGSNSL